MLTTDDVETKIQLPDDILFDYDKSDLKPHAQSTLNELIQSLETLKADTIIQINGHTDNTGDEQYNKTLSEKRAKTVETYLLKIERFDKLKMTSTGFGNKTDFLKNDAEDEKSLNRRVEIVINPK